MEVAKRIREWYNENKRDLPWRKTKDPYIIWLSEIILQQTRVNQGLPYFQKFIRHFPDVKSLAVAEKEVIFKLWQGLGYYRRAENLHKTARIIAFERNGKFPERYEELLKLPGIGPYTAAAIASFAFEKPVAVVDGNVYRVLARITGNNTPVNSPEGQKIFKHLAQDWLDKNHPSLHNQAMMEFGALQCTPLSPDCGNCPVASQCTAFLTGQVENLPVKIPAKKSKKRFLNYLLAIHQGEIYVSLREKKDIWRHLYEFPLIETPRKTSREKIKSLFREKYQLNHPPEFVYATKHILTHRILHIGFWKTGEPVANFTSVPLHKLKNMGFPKPLADFLEKQININNFEHGEIKK